MPSDWPPRGHQEAECDRISNLLGAVMELGIAENFITPVDLNVYPEYAYSIEYPIDLSTIKARLDNRFYRRREALIFDIKHIALNAESFNRVKSDIVKKARIIRDLCIRISTYVHILIHIDVDYYINNIFIFRIRCVFFFVFDSAFSDSSITDVNAYYHTLQESFQWGPEDVERKRGGKAQKGAQPSSSSKDEPQPGPSSAISRSSTRLKQKVCKNTKR